MVSAHINHRLLNKFKFHVIVCGEQTNQSGIIQIHKDQVVLKLQLKKQDILLQDFKLERLKIGIIADIMEYLPYKFKCANHMIVEMPFIK
jgi:hypothetical protein